MTFAEKLRQLRMKVGMTQDVLARASGVSLGAIRDYEQGSREPMLSNAQKLASALGVSLDAFSAVELLAPPVAPSRKLGEKAPEKPRRGRGNKK
jgi:transcriptional regulator with XRE-family HTH domain